MKQETTDGEAMREITSLEAGISPTAANAWNRLYPSSGAIDYTVIVGNGTARTSAVVNAATGDEAAAKAVAQFPGQKVLYVGPATTEARVTTDDFAGV